MSDHKPTQVAGMTFRSALDADHSGPPLGVCDRCGRQTWFADHVGKTCRAYVADLHAMCRGALMPPPLAVREVPEVPEVPLPSTDNGSEPEEPADPFDGAAARIHSPDPPAEPEKAQLAFDQEDAPTMVDARRAAITHRHNLEAFDRQVFSFSVLQAGGGEWQRRKRWWQEVGIEAELGGRDENLLKFSPQTRDPGFYDKKTAAERSTGRTMTSAEFVASPFYEPPSATTSTAMSTSIFDPVLAEAAYRWWCPPGGLILDPFAGGAMRGVVAATLGFRYAGNDLRAEQVESNRAQARSVFADDGTIGAVAHPPEWFVGDASVLPQDPDLDLRLLGGCDFVFSCPPYFDLERYSDDPADLSTMTDSDFAVLYHSATKLACDHLRPDSFAAFVVGEVRSKKGNGSYRQLPALTIRAFEAAGLEFYNDVIYASPVGTAMVRKDRFLRGSGKVARIHQNLLVFVKGDARKAAAKIHRQEPAA